MALLTVLAKSLVAACVTVCSCWAQWNCIYWKNVEDFYPAKQSFSVKETFQLERARMNEQPSGGSQSVLKSCLNPNPVWDVWLIPGNSHVPSCGAHTMHGMQTILKWCKAACSHLPVSRTGNGHSHHRIGAQGVVHKPPLARQSATGRKRLDWGAQSICGQQDRKVGEDVSI